jgi:hypothetical protein
VVKLVPGVKKRGVSGKLLMVQFKHGVLITGSRGLMPATTDFTFT